VSVIIPTFNRRNLVRLAVESALSSEDVDVEVVVVDDGSTDGTGGALGAAALGPRVRCLRQERRGRSAARNLGTAASTGDLVVYLDSDDILLPGGLRIRRDVLDADPRIDVVYGDGFYSDEAGTARQRIGLRWPRFEAGRMLETLVLHNIVTAPHLAMVRRRSLEALGEAPFDESLQGGEDADLWVRLAARGCRFFGIPDAVGLYRLHEGNASSPRSPDRAIREESIRRYRHKVLTADYFGRLPVAVRVECVIHCLLTVERGRPEAQARLLSMRPFLDLPEAERARLLYLLGTQHLLEDGAVALGRQWLRASARLRPWNAKYRLAAALAHVSPIGLGRIIQIRRRLARRRRGLDPSVVSQWRDGPAPDDARGRRDPRAPDGGTG